MASAPHFNFSPLLSLSRNPSRKPNIFLPFITSTRNSVKIRAMDKDYLGDFGARDPFPAEIESNFGDKVLGNVVGWRLVHEEGGLKLRGLWKVRDMKCGEELISRITNAVEHTGHLPTLHLEAPNLVKAELWTSSIGGLSLNDFIVAAKIDEIKISDLQPRQRVWA
ncbi:hypothetical protein DH2020_030681 [Rehmannia glutinosa]|uniref:4a-hydroxytetrahydrobiopterin dehydratase n=1 Tax=Rehmannia glutinosa TaxID=99300 RepID=A0ABR0VLV5_REHGL